MHSVARDGVKVVNTSGDGNAVTCISISEGKDITLCKGTNFAKAYNGNDSCVEYANKACAYSGGGDGSGTKGIHIGPDGKPTTMDHCLEQDITASVKIICIISSPLSYTNVTKALSIQLNKETGFNANDDSKPITARGIITYLQGQGILKK